MNVKVRAAVAMAGILLAGGWVNAETLTLSNGKVALSYDAGARRLTIQSGQRVAMAAPCAAVIAGETSQEVRNDVLVVKSAGGTQKFWVDGPWVLTQVTLNNTGSAPMVVDKVVTLSATIDPEKGLDNAAAAKWINFGSDGPAPYKAGKTSYTFMAVVDTSTRAGVVGGWLTHERSSGIVLARAEAKRADASIPKIEARAEYGRLVIAPGASAEGEIFAMGFFDDARDGMEQLGDAIGKANKITLPRPYCGYSTWYHAHALDQERMAQLAAFSKENHLKDFGFEFLQIDDQWQASRRDFTGHNPKGPYSEGMEKTAKNIASADLMAGLWLTPFGWDKKIPALAEHQDWFVKKGTTGDVYSVNWAGDSLDMSNPEARKFLSAAISRITHEWGYKLLKLDGLWAGMAMTILYPEPAYRDDGLGDAVFHDPAKTNEEVYRDGLRLVREAAGKDVFLLGCNIAQNMRTLGGSIGLVDAMRIGPDIAAKWDNVLRCAKPAAQMYFLNGRVWWNDPDCLMLRDPLTLDEARAWGSFIAISGQMNLVSEWLPGLPAEKLDVLKRTIPNVPHAARPVDLFERELPRQWHMSYGDGETKRDVVALFNWTPASQHSAPSTQHSDAPGETAGAMGKVAIEPPVVKVDLKALGLGDGEYVGFDYWENQFVPALSGTKEFDVRPGSCRVIALVKKVDHPQVLGTSRHVTQGLPDLVSVKWDDAGKVLAGTSRVVIGDPYELRIYAAGMKVVTVKVAKTGESTATASQEGENVRVMIKPTMTGEIEWRVEFAAK